jgi:hypothetical protein
MKLPVEEGKGIYIISHPDHRIILEKKKKKKKKDLYVCQLRRKLTKDEASHPALMHLDNFQPRS